MNDETMMTEAARELEAGLTKISSELEARMLPDGKVAEIWSHDFAEDGRTLIVNAVLEDGSDVFISICPGEPLRIGVQGRQPARRARRVAMNEPSSLTCPVNAGADSLDALKAAFAALRAAIGSSLERANKARDFCFAGGEQLAPGLIEFRCVPTAGTRDLTLRFDITDKFREFTLALAAGEFDGEVVEQTRHGASV